MTLTLLEGGFFAVAAVLGLLFGSFASLVAYRLPRDEDVIGGRSRCPHCGHALSAADLVPVLSYMLNRGACRHCGAAVSRMYPAMEIATAFLFMLVLGTAGVSLVAIPLALLATGLVILTVVDLEHQIIPDQVSLALAVVGGFYLALTAHGVQDWAGALTGALAGFGIAWALRVIFRRIKGREALGLGDVKFFAVAGLWCGISGLADFMMISGFAGIAFAGFWRWRVGDAVFPFGPALGAGLLSVVLLQAAGFPPPLILLMIQ